MGFQTEFDRAYALMDIDEPDHLQSLSLYHIFTLVDCVIIGRNFKSIKSSKSDNIFDSPHVGLGDELLRYVSIDEGDVDNPFYWWLDIREARCFPILNEYRTYLD